MEKTRLETRRNKLFRTVYELTEDDIDILLAHALLLQRQNRGYSAVPYLGGGVFELKPQSNKKNHF
jgi:hypothetical protein